MITTVTNKFFLLLGFAALASCKSYDIKPGSERIRLFESEPKGCIFLGEIPAEQEDTVVGHPSTEPEMSLPTRVELRNKAFALNANVIVFMNKNKKTAATGIAGAPVGDPKKSSATPATGPTSNPPGAMAPAQELEERKIKTVYLATVFRCPPNIVNQ